ncbi:MAG TPA: glycine cleavage system protein GcvH [Clostridiales bacterium]|jgi:glycine cleavage system H protein|nr:glycine cleavage system protein GcvH [Clostridiales bacterium]HCS11357.1 glycine cleavage system protein GcvH [Clostridiales bacterium]
MKVLKGLYYSNDHEWVKVEGDEAFVGITDFAQEHLGDIVYVELPEIDDEFAKEDSFSVVESVKAASDVYLPVSGKVIAVNEALEDDPALLNTDAYENWIVKIALNDKAELDELMTSEEYEKFLEEEA